MRIVSLGLPLPDPQVDNHSIANAPSLFEYDACVLDPQALSAQIEQIVAGTRKYRTPDDVAVLAGSSGPFHFGLGELLAQRRAELARLLESGGVVVALGYPNVPHPAVPGMPGAERYSILPAAPGVMYRPPQLVAGNGEGIRPLDPGHPFAAYIDDLAGTLRYRARWDVEAIPAFDQIGAVVARSHGGAAVAVDFAVGPGRVVFLPPPHRPPRDAERRRLTERMLESIQRALERPPAETPPAWLRSYDLPGVEEARAALAAVESAASESQNRLAEARALHEDAAKYHGLLWRDGRYAFHPLVRDALRTLGFEVSPDLDQPARLQAGDRIALLEIDSSTGTVSERPYLTLQRRIEEEFLRSGERRKGVIVVNGQRHQRPDRREQPFTDTLKNACETFGYALIRADSLFTLVTYALDDPEPQTLARIRDTILNAEGLLVVEEREPVDDRPGARADEPAPSGGEAGAPPAPVAAESGGGAD